MDRNHGENLIRRAAAISASSAHIPRDLGAALFPKSEVLISDRMLSYSRQYLHAAIAEIETRICTIAVEQFGVAHEVVVAIGNSDECHSYPLLEKAGLLHLKSLLDHLFARAQQAELTARLLQKVSQEKLESVLTRHLDDEDAAIADAAMALLVSQSRMNVRLADIENLPAEILYALAWPIIAALEKKSGYSGTRLADAAQKMLSEHDEGASAYNRAQRLAQLLDQSTSDGEQRPHPLEDGLQLFLAKLSHRSGLSIDQITVFTAEPNMVRFVVLMRALKLPSDEALSIFAALDGSGNILTAATYGEIDGSMAHELVAKWTMNSSYREAELLLSDEQSEFFDR